MYMARKSRTAREFLRWAWMCQGISVSMLCSYWCYARFHGCMRPGSADYMYDMRWNVGTPLLCNVHLLGLPLSRPYDCFCLMCLVHTGSFDYHLGFISLTTLPTTRILSSIEGRKSGFPGVFLAGSIRQWCSSYELDPAGGHRVLTVIWLVLVRWVLSTESLLGDCMPSLH